MKTEQASAKLAEMRAHCEAATKGPWEVMEGQRQLESMAVCNRRQNAKGKSYHHKNICLVKNRMSAWREDQANMDLIAHARTDLPALLAVAEAALGLAEAERQFAEQAGPLDDPVSEALARMEQALAGLGGGA